MKKTVIFSWLFLMLASTAVFAETALQAEVDKLSITTDDVLTYKITIKSQEKKIPDPKVPEFKGFGVVSKLQSSSISFMKDEVNTLVSYIFVLSPQEAGKFKIEPSQVRTGAKVIMSEEFEIDVIQGKGKAVPEQEIPPRKPLPESDEPQYTI